MQNKGLFLILTYQCNLKCSYCYERIRLVDNKDIIHSNLTKVINILKSRDDINSITIIGGEALLYKDEILYFLDNIKVINDAGGIFITVNFITNGTIYIDMTQYKDFVHMQISFDGWKDVQNISRPFKNGGETYDIVLSNIKKYFIDDIDIVIHSVIVSYFKWKKSFNNFINDLPSSIPIEIKYVYGKEKNIFRSWINIINTCLAMLFASKHNVSHKQSSASNVCSAGIRHLSIDLNTAKLYYCQECIFYNETDKNVYELGSLTPDIHIDQYKLDKIFSYTDMNNYIIHYLSKRISQIIFKHLVFDICPFRNIEITDRWNIVPFRFVIFALLQTMIK